MTPMPVTAGDPAQGEDRAMEQFVSVMVGREEYAVPIIAVEGIRAWEPTTPIPNSPDHMRGVINIRGAVVPIFDVRTMFGLGHTETTERHVVVVVSVGERTIGLLVDAVHDIVTATPEAMSNVPDIGHGGQRLEYLRALLTIDDRMIGLMALERMFERSTDHDF